MSERKLRTPDVAAALGSGTKPERERRAADFQQAVSQLVRVWLLRERNRAGSHNLSSSAAYALEVLARNEAMGVNDLAAEIFVEKSTASRIVAGLEEKGYVYRKLDPADRRSIRIDVTELGRETFQQMHQDSVREAAKLLESTSTESGAGLTEQLREIARASAGDPPW